MKKLILLGALSVLFYSAPGYAGGDQSKSAAAKPTAEEEARQEDWELVEAPPPAAAREERRAEEYSAETFRRARAEKAAELKQALASVEAQFDALSKKHTQEVQGGRPPAPTWMEILTGGLLKKPTELERMRKELSDLDEQRKSIEAQIRQLT